MAKTIGFDNERYLKEQTQAIVERVSKFGNKLALFDPFAQKTYLPSGKTFEIILEPGDGILLQLVKL